MRPSRRVRSAPRARRNPGDEITFANLFAGGGGWEVGLVPLGLKHLWSIELEPGPARALEANLALMGVRNPVVIVGDVRSQDIASLPRPDLLLASPPCQASSHCRAQGNFYWIPCPSCENYWCTKHGKHACECACEEVTDWRAPGNPYYTRTKELAARDDADLGSEVVRFAAALLPAAGIIENSDRYYLTEVFRNMMAGLSEFGYETSPCAKARCLVEAQYHGTPSSRRRTIARYSSVGMPRMPEKTRPTSWYDAIGDLIEAGAFKRTRIARWQAERLERQLQYERLEYPLLVTGGNPDRPPGGVLGGHKLGHYSRVARGSGEPAFTVVKSIKSMAGTRVLYKDGTALQLDERAFARFVGVPDEYELPRDRTEAVMVLGNIVPPPLARALVEPFLPLLRKRTA
jgi:site-specific DNA-cytosine methylase